jgi:mannose-6-phosphate isomerase
LLPEAELWFGAHPRAPANVRTDSGWESLSNWIVRDPGLCLGSSVATRFSDRLPFLVKLIAVEQPLSLQVHPDAATARQGFEAENLEGVAFDDPTRNYPDPIGKPELVCAMTQFTVLHGLRPPRELAENLAAVGLAGQLPELATLCRCPETEFAERLFRSLLALDSAKRGRVIEAAARAAGDEVCGPLVARCVARLLRHFPDEVCVLAPLLLNLVVLNPGQALFVAPGVLHCYLGGLALEVMASSDNVLRAGLTRKHVEAEEILKVASFAPSASRVLVPQRVSPTQACFSAPAAAFELSAIELEPNTSFLRQGQRGVEVLVCVEGRARAVDLRSAVELELTAGAGVFVPAAARDYRLGGEARVYRVTVPDEATT